MAGKKAALILNGAEPTWLYTEAPSHGKYTINSDTAKKLGISLPNKMKGDTDFVNQ